MSDWMKLPKNEKEAMKLFLEHMEELVNDRHGVIDLPDGRYMLLEKGTPMTLEFGYTMEYAESNNLDPNVDDIAIFQIGMKRV